MVEARDAAEHPNETGQLSRQRIIQLQISIVPGWRSLTLRVTGPVEGFKLESGAHTFFLRKIPVGALWQADLRGNPEGGRLFQARDGMS